MGKLWHNNKEAKKPAILSAKEKRVAKHAKRGAPALVRWNIHEVVAPKSH